MNKVLQYRVPQVDEPLRQILELLDLAPLSLPPLPQETTQDMRLLKVLVLSVVNQVMAVQNSPKKEQTGCYTSGHPTKSIFHVFIGAVELLLVIEWH